MSDLEMMCFVGILIMLCTLDHIVARRARIESMRLRVAPVGCEPPLSVIVSSGLSRKRDSPNRPM